MIQTSTSPTTDVTNTALNTRIQMNSASLTQGQTLRALERGRDGHCTYQLVENFSPTSKKSPTGPTNERTPKKPEYLAAGSHWTGSGNKHRGRASFKVADAAGMTGDRPLWCLGAGNGRRKVGMECHGCLVWSDGIRWHWHLYIIRYISLAWSMIELYVDFYWTKINQALTKIPWPLLAFCFVPYMHLAL